MTKKKLYLLISILATSYFFVQNKSHAQVSISDSLNLLNFYEITGGDNWSNNTNWLTKPIAQWHGVTVNDKNKITSISLEENNLVGNITELESLALPELAELFLSKNNLYGAIPNFKELPNLNILALFGNQISGATPAFDSLPNLVVIDLCNNQLNGSIPNFESLINLYYLDLANNSLSGEVPDFKKNPALQNIYLDHNQFTFMGLEQNIPFLESRECNILSVCQEQSDCVNYAPQDSLTITQTGNQLMVDAGGTIVNNTYTWFKDNIQTTQILGNNTLTLEGAGTYHCQITNSLVPQLTLTTFPYIGQPCPHQPTITLKNPSSTPIFDNNNPPLLICNLDTSIIQSYQWLQNETPIGNNHPFYFVTESTSQIPLGQYSIALTFQPNIADNCDMTTINYIGKNIDFEPDPKPLSSSLTLSPTLNQGLFKLYFKNNNNQLSNNAIHIYNATGQHIYTQTFEPENHIIDMTIDLRGFGLKKGIYYLTIPNSGFVEKLIIY